MEKKPNMPGACPICRQTPHPEDPGFDINVPEGTAGIKPGNYYGCSDCAWKYLPADASPERRASLQDDIERLKKMKAPAA